jgi:hypothetical protein
LLSVVAVLRPAWMTLPDTGEDQLLDRRDVARESGQDVPSSFRSKKLDDCRCRWPNSLLRRFRTNR